MTASELRDFLLSLDGRGYRSYKGLGTTYRFDSNASGSTSQAAAIVEALEVGCACLLIDEDTSATNFLIRDARVQALISGSDEPITPFIDRARALHREKGVSVVMVVGGSGDYFDVADTVIAMREFAPREVTESTVAERVRFGEGEIELSAVEQLVEAAQTRAIGRALARARGEILDGRSDVPTALGRLMEVIDREGLDWIDDRLVGDYDRISHLRTGSSPRAAAAPAGAAALSD